MVNGTGRRRSGAARRSGPERESRFAALRRALAETPAEAVESYAEEVAEWERVAGG